MKRILFSIVCISIVSAAFAEPNVPDMNTQLIQAAKKGDLAAVQNLLDSGADVNAKRNIDGVTALIWAALNGRTEVVKLLLEKGADVNAVSDSGLTALDAAKTQGHTDIVQILKRPNMAIPVTKNVSDSNTENSALYKATYEGNLEEVKSLISNGADVNARWPKRFDSSPLHFTVSKGHENMRTLFEISGFKADEIKDRTKDVNYPRLYADIVSLLIANGADINAKDSFGWMPLHTAAQFGYSDMVKLLVAKGAKIDVFTASAIGDINAVKSFINKDPNEINFTINGYTPLHAAAQCGRMEVVQYLIEKGADINAGYPQKPTPLFSATTKGNVAILELLASKGAKLDSEEFLPLFGAIWAQNKEAIDFLISKGADVNAKDSRGATALIMAADMGYYDICECLIAKGADVNAEDKNGGNVVTSAYMKEHLDVVKLLFEKGADVNEKYKDGQTALMVASEDGHPDIVKLLIEKGTDINTKNNNGKTALDIAKEKNHTDIVQILEKALEVDKFPLCNAANRGNIEKVKELIAKGYNVNERDDANWTPLHRAIQSGNKEIAAILIANGADVNAENNIGGIPIMLAVIRDYNDIFEMLLAKGAQRTIYVAAAQGDIEEVRALLKKDPNLINTPAKNDGWSALHWAAYMGHWDMIKFLIENEADTNIRAIRENSGGEATPLFWAVRKGRLDAAKFLIDKGADVKIKIKGGSTILHCPGTFETAKLLVDNGADVNAKDDHGMTPLHSIADRGGLYVVQNVLFWNNGGNANTWKTDYDKYRDAAEKVTAQIAAMLIAKGADVNAKDEKGNTPLSNAKATNNKALIELLEKYNTTAASGELSAEQTLDSSLNIDCGILYCARDEKNNVSDIFIADPKLHTKINLTRGRLKTEGWSQPWEPVGSPDGQTVVLRQFKRLDNGKKIENRIWLLDMKDQSLQQVPGNFGRAGGFAWSPDSSSFAFYNENEITVCDKKTLNLKTVATEGDTFCWSPDGQWLAFTKKNENTYALQLTSQKNNEKKQVTTGLDTDNICWCPDSQKLAIIKNSQLSIVLLNGEIQKQYGQASNIYSWSHNGAYIAYGTKISEKQRSLRILSLADEQKMQIDFPGDNSNGIWSPESDLLAFWNMMGSDTTLMIVGPDGKNTQKVDSPHLSGFMPPSWLPVRQTKQGYQDENKIKIPAVNEPGSPNSITFKSVEPAPNAFDAWCLEGMIPIGDANAVFWYVVIQPDGQECERRDFPKSAVNRYYKSYFKPGSSKCTPRVFYNKSIKVCVRADKDSVVFEQSDIDFFKFQFFKKNAAGQIDWNPFKTINAVLEP
ncbi:MAG: ankyrin repeat domain-containing protein [Phycisphaerae bacterium]|jgi:ankyrin repeat protein